jgi:hypothetical protein
MARSQVDGRPTKLTQVLRKDDAGNDVTLGDELIERMRYGASTYDAAAAVGINRDTLMDWLREGARHAARRQSGEKLSKRDRDLADFSDREAQAIGQWKADAERTLQNLSVLRRRVTVVEKEIGGAPVERTVRTEQVEPDAKVIMWRLERRWPQQYGRSLVEVSGPDGGPISVDVKAEARAVLESMVERIAANTRPATEELPPAE